MLTNLFMNQETCKLVGINKVRIMIDSQPQKLSS